ncbi:DMT family transporter [Rubripirellula reticaptiva]|uniref:EamA-like transporter family protein n=1 Tax=Rubripirellula reticaptiva TaxID=2528013 RepID=A0A5C6FCA1_9BACT|nr:DMT family transporter [Rubripirellula reticaptiva]TWU57201.1 EamA-like transporter family protein [Rubripirellula reticaptiva]
MSIPDPSPYQSPKTLEPTRPKTPPLSHPPPIKLWWGAACGMAAAVLYTVSNIALRQSVSIDPFLVSAVKAGPTVLFLGPVIAWMFIQGHPIATNRRMIPQFMLVALMGQFVGNAAFQIALGVIGLAAAVPITLGVLLIGGAMLGRIVLGEPVRTATVVSMVTLIIAAIVLSLPSSTPKVQQASSELPMWVGGLSAAASGAAYALFGVVMRKTMNDGVSAPLTMFLSGAVGTVALWSFTLIQHGTEPIAMLESNQWVVMGAGGLFNFLAFVALSYALKALPVVAVNLINASQVAMAAMAGVVLFAEPVTWQLMSGIGLTFAGLLILMRGRLSPFS